MPGLGTGPRINPRTLSRRGLLCFFFAAIGPLSGPSVPVSQRHARVRLRSWVLVDPGAALPGAGTLAGRHTARPFLGRVIRGNSLHLSVAPDSCAAGTAYSGLRLATPSDSRPTFRGVDLVLSVPPAALRGLAAYLFKKATSMPMGGLNKSSIYS